MPGKITARLDFWGRARKRALLYVVVIAALFVPAVSASAQTPQPTPSLILKNDTGRYDLAPYLFVTKDKSNNISYKTIYERHTSGLRGDAVRGDVVSLGAGTVPHWIVFGIENQSINQDWVLSFGTHMDGRFGLVKKMFLYDHLSRTTYLDNVSAVGSQTLNAGDPGVRLKIAPGQKALFFMYVVPRGGGPATLAFDLMTAEEYGARTRDHLKPAFLFNLLMAAVTGFFLAAALFKRYWPAGVFAFYCLLQIALFNYQNESIFLDFPLASHMSAWIFAAAGVTAILMSRFFFDIDSMNSVQSKATVAFIALILVAVAAALLIPESSALRAVLLYVAPLAAYVFLVILSMAQVYNGHVAALQMLLAWGVLLAGFLTTLLSIVNVLPPSGFLIAAYWCSLVPQGILFLAALSAKFLYIERLQEAREVAAEQEKTNLSHLKQNKEAAENQRLHRLIEHERDVMNELREREIKQNEETRKARIAADDANRAKSAFLAVISHEIRTPMTGIMGMVRLLLDTSLDKSQKDYAQTIQDSGDAMIALLNDILDFEKIETGKMDLEQVDYDLHRLIHSVVTLMSGHAAAKGIYLKVDMDAAIPRYVIGDPVRLRQVLLNLTGNSIKFTADGGVTLHVKIDPSMEAKEGRKVHRIRFSVADTGVGISKEAQKNLFNPFSQADSSIARKFGGSGLGLAISQKLITAMGGKIMIDSTEGHGSTFFFTLLMQEGSAAAVGEKQKTPQKSEKSLQILIVEDNEINQKLLKEFVDRMGHQTSLAGSGEDCLKILKERAFDMILMDVELPGMSGMGTTKAIRALPDRTKAAIPVIALTGNVQDKDIRECFAANMNGHLAKPVDPHKLRIMIEKAIAGTLDNPVQLPEGKEEFVRVNRLGAGAAPPAEAPPPAAKPAAAAKGGEGKKEEKKPEKDAFARYDEASKSREVNEAPIVKMAFDLEDIDLSDEDLEEDSFETAMKTPEPKVANGVAVFDENMVKALRDSLGQIKFYELISGVFEKTDEILAALEGKSAASHGHEIVARAHELKGMAGNFGLKELSSVAAHVEKSVKEGKTEGIDSALADLPLTARRAKDALQQWMDGP